LSRKRKRDIYGNWTWDEDDADSSASSNSLERNEKVKLEWRDIVALTIASLETFLLPVVIFLLVIFIIALVFVHL
jgi:hypothetical protein